MVAKCMFYEEHVVILFSIIVFQLVTDKPRPPGSCELSFAAPSFFLAGRWREWVMMKTGGAHSWLVVSGQLSPAMHLLPSGLGVSLGQCPFCSAAPFSLDFSLGATCYSVPPICEAVPLKADLCPQSPPARMPAWGPV